MLNFNNFRQTCLLESRQSKDGIHNHVIYFLLNICAKKSNNAYMSYSKKMSGILFETQCTSQCLLFTFILRVWLTVQSGYRSSCLNSVRTEIFLPLPSYHMVIRRKASRECKTSRVSCMTTSLVISCLDFSHNFRTDCLLSAWISRRSYVFPERPN